MNELKKCLYEAMLNKDAVVVIGETGIGKTSIINEFIEENGLSCLRFSCNCFSLKNIQVFLEYNNKEYDTVFFDMIDCCDEEVRDILLNEVKKCKSLGLFVIAAAWPTKHFNREPISKERYAKYFNGIINYSY